MLQVLLHFLILSHPYDSTSSQPGDKKRKRRGKKKAEPTPPDHQENLDVLTDRLCIWRETEFALSDDNPPSYFSSSSLNPSTERDWLQTFCEDVVRPAFAAALPPLYESFRAKCFPELVADIDDTETDEPKLAKPSSGISRKFSRMPSKQSQQTSAEPSSSSSLLLNTRNSSMSRQRSGSSGPASADALSLPPRTFSRSNSVVSNSTSGGANSQRLNANSRREVSMRRSMSIQRDPSVGPSGNGANAKGKEKEGMKAVSRGKGTFAVGTTSTAAACQGRSSSFSIPNNHRQNSQANQTTAQSQTALLHSKHPRPPARSATTSAAATLLVPETPIPARTFGRAATLNDLGGTRSAAGWNSQFSNNPNASMQQNNMFFDDPFEDEEDGDDDAMMMLTDEPGSSRGRAILVQSTPSRPRAYSMSSSTGATGMQGGTYGLGKQVSDRVNGASAARLPPIIPETPTK